MISRTAAPCGAGARRYSARVPTPWQRDLERDRTRLTAWLAGRLPGASRIEVHGLRAPESSGFSNDTLLFDGSATCPEPLVGPLFDFPRDNGVCVVIGGVVSRDPRIQALSGRYLYGDLCAGTITVVGIDGTKVTRSDVLDVKVPLLSSFGVDGAGRVYAMSAQGPVYRLDPR